MTDTRYLTLGDAIESELFPDIDLALRRGRHINREEAESYGYLVDAQALLEVFYRRFGCELVHPSDGYFYLLPTNDKLGRRHLSVPEMLVGQALTLLYLDPNTLQHGGVIKRVDALSHLAAVMGPDALTRALNPKRKRMDERVAQETVRNKFAEALRRLATLGFVELLDTESLRLLPSLLRFAEPVRGRGSPAEALERLVARGELVMGDGESGELDEELSLVDETDAADDEPPAPEEPAVPPEMLREFDDFAEDFGPPAAAPLPELASPEPEPEAISEDQEAEPSELPEDAFTFPLPDFEEEP